MPNTALICMQNMPEVVEFYLVRNLADDDKRMLKRANNHYVNGAENTPEVEQAVCNVLAACDKNPENWKSSNVPKEWLRKGWHKHKIDQSKLNRLPPCVLINTGCYM